MRAYVLGTVIASILLLWFATYSDSWIFDDRLPSPRAKMGRQVAAAHEPRIVILGSSRAAFGIASGILADELGLPRSAVVNAAFPGMLPDQIERGWSIYEQKLKSAKLVIYTTDDYYFHLPPNASEPSILKEIAIIRKLGNVPGNLAALIDKEQADLYRFDENGLLRHPKVETVDRMTDPKVRAQTVEQVTAAWWNGWQPAPVVELQMVSFGKRVKSHGARILFVHLPMHSGQRELTQKKHAREYATYLAGMRRIADGLGTDFLLLDRPEALGLSDDAFIADTIHLRPEHAKIATKHFAEVIRKMEGARLVPGPLTGSKPPVATPGRLHQQDRP